jgi:hypothetical protein
MSVSGFHHHFKAVTAMSPLRFQKQLRLQEAGASYSVKIWTPPVPATGWATTTPRNSAGSTSGCSASLPCGTWNGCAKRRGDRPDRRRAACVAAVRRDGES